MDRTRGVVTVVLTTYYRNDWLPEAIESVRQQTYDPVELVVVDGSTTGHARSVVEDAADLSYIAQDANEGPHADRSLGAASTDGTYVQFLDDDDRLAPEKLERQVSLLEREPDVGVAYCGAESVDGVTLPTPSYREDVLGPALSLDLFPCQTSAMLIERSALDPILPLQNRHGIEDAGMMIELASRTEFDFVDAPLFHRGLPPGQRSLDRRAVTAGMYELLDRYDHLYEKYPDRRTTVERRAAASAVKLALEEQYWSSAAVRAAFRLLRQIPDPTVKDVLRCLSTLGGRPGYALGVRLWHAGGRLRADRGDESDRAAGDL